VSSLPQIRVASVRKVFDDGNHNAFTDLCLFQGRFYLAFRTCPDGHGVFATSRIVVLASDDASTWRRAFDFGVRDRDCRDPHLLVFRGRLFVYTGTWFCDPAEPGRRDLNEHLGYAAWTDDGESWHGPRFLEGTYGHYVWRAAAHEGKAYLCGRRNREFRRGVPPGHEASERESAMLESEDGFVWRPVGLFQETGGNETAFLFEQDGSVLALARGPGKSPALVCRSRPPYAEWSRVELDRSVGGPLLARWGGRLLAGGRSTVGAVGPRTVLYWLANDRLELVAELPSGGDNSYPGFVSLDEGRGLVSYYSSHEGSRTSATPAAIYLAEVETD